MKKAIYISLIILCSIFITEIISAEDKKQEIENKTCQKESINSNQTIRSNKIYKTDIFNILILVNKDKKIPCDYKPELIEYNNRTISKYIKNDLNKMINAAKKENITLVINSAYRSIASQQKIYDNNVTKWKTQGYSYEEAILKTERSVNKPYYSEHHTGLAIDFMDSKDLVNNLNSYEWLKNNAYKYGFILRYPENKTHITKVMYEPWHYRYVGKAIAKYIYENNLTLEEYLENYK